MKFLMIAEDVARGELPSKEFLLILKAQWAWSRTLMAAGRVVAAYALADHAGGLMGGISIFSSESLEELAEDLASMPAAGVWNIKVYPLVIPEVAEKLIEARLQEGKVR